MKNIPIQKLYRIQGGIFPNRSRDFIRVNNNKISCSKSRNIHIGNKEHATYFLFKRFGINQIEELPKDAYKYDIHVIEMYVPYWVTYLMEKYSVENFCNTDTSFPKLVDQTTPRTILSNNKKLE